MTRSVKHTYLCHRRPTSTSRVSASRSSAQLARRILTGAVSVENNKVYQTVTMNGEVVSQQSDGKHHPLSSRSALTVSALDNDLKYLYSSNECYTGSGNCGLLQGYSM